MSRAVFELGMAQLIIMLKENRRLAIVSILGLVFRWTCQITMMQHKYQYWGKEINTIFYQGCFHPLALTTPWSTNVTSLLSPWCCFLLVRFWNWDNTCVKNSSLLHSLIFLTSQTSWLTLLPDRCRCQNFGKKVRIAVVGDKQISQKSWQEKVHQWSPKSGTPKPGLLIGCDKKLQITRNFWSRLCD